MNNKRVSFDFEIEFSNGGGIQGQEFRLDIDGEEISDHELAAYIVKDLRLIMVANVKILNKQIIIEQHKRLTERKESDEPSEVSNVIDLSHTIEDGMVTYKGLPAPIICDHISHIASRGFYSEGTEFQIGRIDMVGNTGTYIDTPFHRYQEGFDLAGMPLEIASNLPGLVVRLTNLKGRAIDWANFAALEVKGRAVLIQTNWDQHWRTDQYFEGHPFLTEESAQFLRDRGAKLVGIDSMNIDDTSGGSRPVHSVLLAAGIPIVEHLTNLTSLPTEGFRFYAVPPKIVKMGTFPVRAHAILNVVAPL